MKGKKHCCLFFGRNDDDAKKLHAAIRVRLNKTIIMKPLTPRRELKNDLFSYLFFVLLLV